MNPFNGKLEFECETKCQCEEPVSFKYQGLISVNDVLAEEKVGVISLATQEQVSTTYSIKSSFNINKCIQCGYCNATIEGVINCVASYTHPVTATTKLMVVVIDGDHHQVVSVPLVKCE